MSVVKNEQFKVFYEAFEIQPTEIARQQQIITCLIYRFALERLPQKDASIMTQTSPRTSSATGVWQKMWRLAVEAELDRMLVEYIDPQSLLLAPSTTSGTTSATGVAAIGTTTAVPSHNTSANSATVNTPKPPHSLKKLLQSDFDYWTSKQKSTSDLQVAKKNKNVPTGAGLTGPADVPAGVAVVAGANGTVVAGVTVTGGNIALATSTVQPPPNGASWTTGKYVRVEFYKPPYDKWSSFSYGHTLYGELSSNIHTYQKSYDIDETNFTKSQRTILEWLAPRDLAKSLEDRRVMWETVDWEEQWARRILTT
ncbi:MAG: hypothetical protein HETSPECPRED_004720 [Heterodermia speciosa]|uniref:Uncharacterized protein n=1 Tax=Heterodermia speciosa TaxID=116794 RepID=A0A8H3PJ14_9LECA|nr:MAG: hypothetical protein HETSPECPRED_004720 [Heterodermia speciosa]